MTLDALALGCLRDELRATLLGGRVQHVYHAEPQSLVLELYARGARHWLYSSGHPEQARAYLAARRPERATDHVSPLLLLARKYLDGARLEAVEQPPLERLLLLRFSRRSDGDEEDEGGRRPTTLAIELIGRRSNLVLVDATGTVLDALRRVTDEMSRTRVVLPHRPYRLPVRPEKLDPRVVEGDALAQAAARHPPDRPARAVLAAEVAACSPLLARETVYAVHGTLDTPAVAARWEALAAALRDRWAAAEAGAWRPTVAYEGGRLIAFAPYELRSFADVRPVASISRAIEQWFGQPMAPQAGPADAQAIGAAPSLDARGAQAPAEAALAARKQPLRQALEAALDRLRAKRYSLERQDADPAELERLRRAGDYLLTHAARLGAGRSEVQVDDGAGDPFTIALDPRASAVENAQRLFARYHKLRAAAREVPALLEATERELRYLEEALLHLELARTPDALEQLRAEWAELGYVAPPKQRREPRAGRAQKPAARHGGESGFERIWLDDFELLVGRSGKGNDALLGRESHPEDLWLHARGVPGAHVLIRSRGRAVPEGVLRRAAALAAAHSQARAAARVAVDYTARRHVERVKGGPPGLVTYRGERTIFVAPEPLSAPHP